MCNVSEFEPRFENSELAISFNTTLIYRAVTKVLPKYLPDQNKFSAVLLGRFSRSALVLGVE